MGWKGTLRTVNSMSRKMDRAAKKQQRELEKQRKQIEKMQELERAAYEVQVYENYIDTLLTIHKECSEVCDWDEIRLIGPPIKPNNSQKHEEAAQNALDNYKPGFSDKLLGKSDSKRLNMVNALEDAKKSDKKNYQEALDEYENECANWKETTKIAEGILNGDTEAYLNAIDTINPFDEIKELGSSIVFSVYNKSLVDVTLRVKGDQIIPSEAKSLLKSGKLSVKTMPKSKFYELYQDHVCCCILRIARELFALLPIDIVMITAVSDVLNPQTGHMEEKAILSAAIPRKTIEKLNFETLDPSDAMANFVHRMIFKKTKGFDVVERITSEDLQLTT